MKTLFKYYLLPFAVLIVLNIFLLIYINRFQNHVSPYIQAIDKTSEYLSLISEIDSDLDHYLITNLSADSLQYSRLMLKIQRNTDSLLSYYPIQIAASDSLDIFIKKYLLILSGLEEKAKSGAEITSDELLAFGLQTHQFHQKIGDQVAGLHQKNTQLLISNIDRSKELVYYMMVLYLIFLSTIIGIAYFYLIGPLNRLRKEIKQLSLGKYSQINVQRDDEIGELIHAFNETSLTLKRSEENLKHTNEKLEVTNKELESFAYSVSHDLRSPLRSISGFSEALVSNFADDLTPQAKDYLNRVHKAAIKMGELIDEILKLSRISRRDINRIKVDVTALSREVIELTNSDNAANSSFKVKENLSIYADEGLTKIILLNLISNAIKFSRSEENPVVKIGQITREGIDYIYVKDNGVGFDMKYADKIFGAFQRLHPDSAFEGAGIGLATVKRIINKHNGDIFFESTKGEGTTVYFHLGT